MDNWNEKRFAEIERRLSVIEAEFIAAAARADRAAMTAQADGIYNSVECDVTEYKGAGKLNEHFHKIAEHVVRQAMHDHDRHRG